jgi:hypothetical protein
VNQAKRQQLRNAPEASGIPLQQTKNLLVSYSPKKLGFF